MDQQITRKLRMDMPNRTQQTALMEKKIDYELMDQAEVLALTLFGPRAECEHIEAVYERLVANQQLGLSLASAITVH